MEKSITRKGAPLCAFAHPPLSAEEAKEQFEAERLKMAESLASSFGQLEGLLLAALADGSPAEIKAGIWMVGEAVAKLAPSLWRYGSR